MEENAKAILRHIDSDTVKIFNHLLRLISEVRIPNEFPGLFLTTTTRILSMLITDETDTIELSCRRGDKDEWCLNIVSKSVYKSIQWISDNLDVWDIEELPYNEVDKKRVFKFKRRIYGR
jgi:hypothetical protein